MHRPQVSPRFILCHQLSGKVFTSGFPTSFQAQYPVLVRGREMKTPTVELLAGGALCSAGQGLGWGCSTAGGAGLGSCHAKRGQRCCL